MTAFTPPIWADNRKGRALISAIIAERPDYSIRNSDMACSTADRVFHSANCTALRKMHENAMNAACAAMDEAYETPGYADARADFAAIAFPTADDVIARLIDDALTVCVGDPLRRDAA